MESIASSAAPVFINQRLWSQVPERALRPDAIVDLSPGLHKRLRFVQRVQYFSVEELMPQLPDERLDIAVLPRTYGLECLTLVQGPG
jgi:hypothetical protein